MKNPGVALGIRVLACTYIGYLAIKLFGGVADGSVTGRNAVISIVAGVLFIALAAAFLIVGIRAFKRAAAEAEEEMNADEIIEEETEEVPEERKRISLAASYVNIADDDEAAEEVETEE